MRQATDTSRAECDVPVEPFSFGYDFVISCIFSLTLFRRSVVVEKVPQYESFLQCSLTRGIMSKNLG